MKYLNFTSQDFLLIKIFSQTQILVSQCGHLPVEREEAVAIGNHAPPPLVHHCGHHGEEGEDEEDEGLSLSDQVPDGRHREEVELMVVLWQPGRASEQLPRMHYNTC